MTAHDGVAVFSIAGIYVKLFMNLPVILTKIPFWL
jgi:hypothetical protein